jgi:hypothetical protein
VSVIIFRWVDSGLDVTPFTLAALAIIAGLITFWRTL